MIDHTGALGQAPGIESALRTLTLVRSTFPPGRTEIEDMIAEGDKVVFRGTSSGTHQGELMGLPPTGMQISVSGVHIMRLANDKIVEHWACSDQMGMMRQLGMVPAPAQTKG